MTKTPLTTYTKGNQVVRVNDYGYAFIVSVWYDYGRVKSDHYSEYETHMDAERAAKRLLNK